MNLTISWSFSFFKRPELSPPPPISIFQRPHPEMSAHEIFNDVACQAKRQNICQIHDPSRDNVSVIMNTSGSSGRAAYLLIFSLLLWSPQSVPHVARRHIRDQNSVKGFSDLTSPTPVIDDKYVLKLLKENLRFCTNLITREVYWFISHLRGDSNYKCYK